MGFQPQERPEAASKSCDKLVQSSPTRCCQLAALASSLFPCCHTVDHLSSCHRSGQLPGHRPPQNRQTRPSKSGSNSRRQLRSFSRLTLPSMIGASGSRPPENGNSSGEPDGDRTSDPDGSWAGGLESKGGAEWKRTARSRRSWQNNRRSKPRLREEPGVRLSRRGQAMWAVSGVSALRPGQRQQRQDDPYQSRCTSRAPTLRWTVPRGPPSQRGPTWTGAGRPASPCLQTATRPRPPS